MNGESLPIAGKYYVIIRGILKWTKLLSFTNSMILLDLHVLNNFRTSRWSVTRIQRPIFILWSRWRRKHWCWRVRASDAGISLDSNKLGIKGSLICFPNCIKIYTIIYMIYFKIYLANLSLHSFHIGTFVLYRSKWRWKYFI